MVILNVNLNNINLDYANFYKDGPKTIIFLLGTKKLSNIKKI